jgi:reverse gyrase
MEQKLIEELKEKLEAEKISLEKELERFAKKDDMPKATGKQSILIVRTATLWKRPMRLRILNNLLPIDIALKQSLGT